VNKYFQVNLVIFIYQSANSLYLDNNIYYIINTFLSYSNYFSSFDKNDNVAGFILNISLFNILSINAFNFYLDICYHFIVLLILLLNNTLLRLDSLIHF
jgi:hypothetical protein